MSDVYMDFMKERLEKAKNNKWHKNDIYFDESAFLKEIKNNKYKVGMSSKSIKEIKLLLNTPHSDVKFSDCDENLIVLGRANSFADRDYKFFINTQNTLSSITTKNSLFINYTGHCGSVGAALASNKIPLIWVLDLSDDARAEKRVIEQLQDYFSELSTQPTHDNHCFGLMLECPHGDFETFDIKNFPTIEFLKENNIKNVYVFVEEPAETTVLFDDYNFYHDAFKEYLVGLKSNFNLKLIPVDEKSDQEKLEVKKHKLKDVKIYYSNFNCKKI